MKISDILSPVSIITHFTGTEKYEIINELIDSLESNPEVNDLEMVRKAVIDREKILSTGVGKGFAIPHGKTFGVNNMIAAFGKTAAPIDFEALDAQPVNMLFLLVGRENAVGMHLKLLSRIARLLNNEDFRQKLLNANSPEEIHQIFLTEESQYFDIND
ncbi:MAG: PTS sugar transporter subunit IIA [Ignavibacteriales bacterium]|nr:PTS sugar transporter subunit IIA [Ignavibacteriales bacterium]MCF8316476.1 PTS sugar transporter subunit IIA [Ignavibacteriales bacterium]MCF8437956.1 PTS sugar transporter subunit IIA [Ignavibacteriales bacterium]